MVVECEEFEGVEDDSNNFISMFKKLEKYYFDEPDMAWRNFFTIDTAKVLCVFEPRYSYSTEEFFNLET